MPMLMFHDDDCDELLDSQSLCPKCGFHPDMQSAGLKEITDREINECLGKGQTMMGSRRVPVVRPGGITIESVDQKQIREGEKTT